jgi:PmbA protein
MNFNKFFLKAKEAGITVSEINISKDKSTSISIFKEAIDNFSMSSSSRIAARGVFNGKVGAAVTEKDDTSTVDFLISNIKDTAEYVQHEEEPIIFKGSEKYHKKNVFNKDLEAWETKDILSLLFSLEKTLQNADKRVTDVQLSFEKSSNERTLVNSYGLKLKNNSNYFVIYAEVIMKLGDEIKSEGKVFIASDPKAFDSKQFSEDIISKCGAKFNGIDIKNGAYKTVLNQDSVSALLKSLMLNVSSEETQKHSSLFEGKEKQQIVSKKLTISDMPLLKNPSFTYFDDEGVATFNKKIVDKGILETLLYNLNTAKKAGVESTGNGFGGLGKIGVDFVSLFVKPGKLTQEQLFEKIGNGVFITDVTGLHAGLNSRSGEFNLQAEGFVVKGGKKGSPLKLFTLSGNLFKMFNDVIAIGSDNEYQPSGTTCPSIAFKGLKISQ